MIKIHCVVKRENSFKKAQHSLRKLFDRNFEAQMPGEMIQRVNACYTMMRT